MTLAAYTIVKTLLFVQAESMRTSLVYKKKTLRDMLSVDFFLYNYFLINNA